MALPNAPVTQLSTAALMPTGDGRVGLLRAGTYGRGLWEIPLLTAASPAQPLILLSSTSLTFADQAMSTISAAQTITVTNTGSAALVVSRIVTTGDFKVMDTCAGTLIAVNASCSAAVQFLPSAQGIRNGLLTVYANVGGGQVAAKLSGRGTAPGDVVLTPLTLIFPTTTINSGSVGQSITISNVGGAAAALQVPSITGDFRIDANTCGPGLAPGTGCTVTVVFWPTAGGVRTGSFAIAGSSGTQTAFLTGTGSTPATDSLSPTSLSFGQQQLGTASLSQEVILTNAGDAPLSLISAKISLGDFVAVNGCGSSLNGHSSCAISVAHVPKSVGAGSGVLVVADQFRSQTIDLNGIGVAPPGVSLSPSGIMAFPATAAGMRSPAQSVTLTNNGGLPLTFQSMAISGDFVFASGGSCGTVLLPSAACVFQVAFAPSAGGTRSGALVITDNAPTSPHALSLTGPGIDFTLGADGSTSAAVASGKSVSYPLLLSSAAGMSGTAVFSCKGAPLNSTCVVSPVSVPLGSTTLVTVTVVLPTVARRGEIRDAKPGTISPFVLAGLLPLGVLVLRRRGFARFVGVLAVVCVVAGGGCGVGREIPAPGSSASGQITGTPAGNYMLTVAATSSGLTRTMGLSLTVQ